MAGSRILGMAAQTSLEPTAAEIAHTLYQGLAASGHAAYCPARLGPLYDEERGHWGDGGSISECSCGRDSALAAYEAWKSTGSQGSAVPAKP